MAKIPQSTPAVSARRGAMAATIRRLAGIATLAAALMVVTTTPAEASTITCGFGSNPSHECSGSPTSRLFFFGPYALELNFGAFGGGVIGGFDVTFEDVHTNQSNLQGLLPAGAVCIPIAGLGSGDNCIVFSMLPPIPVQGVNFTGDYRIDITWLAPTDGDFPDAPGGRVRLLHDSSLVPGGVFGADITIPGSYFAASCDLFLCDPGIGGRDNNFQNFVVVQRPTAVPEPTTLVLVASGIGSVWYRRRRRHSDASRR